MSLQTHFMDDPVPTVSRCNRLAVDHSVRTLFLEKESVHLQHGTGSYKLEFFIMRSFPLTGSDPHRKSVILSLGAGRSRNFLHFFQVRIDLQPTQAKTSFFEPKRRSQHRLCPYFPLKPRSDAPMHQRLCCVPSSHPSLHSFISLSILRTSLSLLFPLSVNSAMDQH